MPQQLDGLPTSCGVPDEADGIFPRSRYAFAIGGDRDHADRRAVSLQRESTTAIGNLPYDRLSIGSAGDDPLAIGCKNGRIYATGMTLQHMQQSPVSGIPDLGRPIIAGRHDQLVVWREGR